MLRFGTIRQTGSAEPVGPGQAICPYDWPSERLSSIASPRSISPLLMHRDVLARHQAPALCVVPTTQRDVRTVIELNAVRVFRAVVPVKPQRARDDRLITQREAVTTGIGLCQ